MRNYLHNSLLNLVADSCRLFWLMLDPLVSTAIHLFSAGLAFTATHMLLAGPSDIHSHLPGPCWPLRCLLPLTNFPLDPQITISVPVLCWNFPFPVSFPRLYCVLIPVVILVCSPCGFFPLCFVVINIVCVYMHVVCALKVSS